jgi:hypothetical protein
MTFLTFVLIGLSALLTWVLPSVANSIQRIGGPDSVGAEFQYVLVCGPRWLFLAVVLGVLVVRDSFRWVNNNKGIQFLVVFGVHGAVGILSALALLCLREPDGLIRAGFWVFSMGVPIIIMVYAIAALDAPGVMTPVWARALMTAVGPLALVGCVLAVQIHWQWDRAARDKAEVSAREAREALAKRVAEFQTLPKNAPLIQWLPYVDAPDEEIRESAVRAVAARETLVPDLLALLKTEDRVVALRYMWLRMPDAPDILAEPTRDSIGQLAEWSGPRLEKHDPGDMRKIADACEASVVLADHFGSSGVDFRPVMSRLKASLGDHPSEWTDQVSQMVQGWLTEHTAKTP